MHLSGYLQRKEGVSGNAPCLDGTGILVEFVASRFIGGESVEELATDYSVNPARIEAALRLVLFARGTNLSEKRAATRVASVLPLLRR